MSEPIRLGGMALENGVLVHGPTHWACAVRRADGELEVASGRKPIRSGELGAGLLRGPLKLAETFALLPLVRRELPEARLPYERPAVLAAVAASALTARGIRGTELAPVLQEALAGLLAVAPAAAAVRGSSVAEYHGAEHISIGTHEHGEPREREHERCGSHLVAPLLVTSLVGSLAARAAPPQLRALARAGAALGALASSVELFGWMVRNEDHPVARALSRPGHELQRRLLTADPTAEQLEVAEAALAECLRLEAA
ncbi:MAG: DUF1385 domain-containing protein [Actinomycetota bacterium]|nr:DUF1385 domain-containing protein [Actinomycetota bacterium]